MAMLIDIGLPAWMSDESLRDHLKSLLPQADIRTAADPGDPADIEMLVLTRRGDSGFDIYPNLALVQKLGAGVEQLAAAPDLAAHVRITRLKSDQPAREIAEYSLAWVLAEQRQIRQYLGDQAQHRWEPVPPGRSQDITVGILGLGHIGSRTARLFRAVDMSVIGWSRTEKSLPGIECLNGRQGLFQLIENSDYVISILPSTPETRNLFNQDLFRRMKDDAVLINAGRGDLIVEDDLIDALDTGLLRGAVLDVFHTEPLPRDHAFWDHPAVVITPHVSGWHLDDGLPDVAENYRRLKNGESLLNEVDRNAGY